ncbi:ABC transporter permease subunit [Shimwellia pseudoproteus]|uniref:ABC transporter permease subunit n=1 Tax=Shimwellia pseudoproteus TaxID=570012 RepID=UPI0018ECD455|nr:ABC transporter permease subunit [Shimwellia pseudoproteus]MBJ3813953.1 ABC transporter permease subunit [Shimwellia pseudoproteus]
MAAPLRHPLTTGLSLLAAGIIGFPILPGLYNCVQALASPPGWGLLLGEAQLPRALAATLISTLVALGGALLLVLVIVSASWPGPRWQRQLRQLPWLLAVPHLAVASALLLLFSDGGWLSRIWPAYHSIADPWGLGMGLVLALKEGGFLLWVTAGLIGREEVAPRMMAARTLGYRPWQAVILAVVPGLLPALVPTLLASAAWSLSVVDVALVIGPGNPPTLAVLSWQWLNDADPARQQAGLLVALLLVLLLAGLSLLGWLLWRLFCRCSTHPGGKRRRDIIPVIGPLGGGIITSVTWLALAILAVTSLVVPFSASLAVSLTAWQWLDLRPLYNTLIIGLLSSAIGGVVSLLWLYSGLSRVSRLLWLPLVLPALPLISGQYHTLLAIGLDGQLAGVIWSHLLWVLPWMLMVLQPAWRAIDPRLALTARTLGWGSARRFWRLTLPLMLRPLLTAFAIGFSVSVAQYLSTLYNGGGRIPTLTTEAVALSSGGDVQRQSGQALLLALLPLALFLLSAALRRWQARRRQGVL